MKSSEIKIGEKYKVDFGHCGKVLETRIEMTGWGGNSRKEGVKVRFQGGHRDGQEKIIPSREVYELWSDHEERENQHKLRRKVAAQDNQRSKKLVKKLQKALRGNGIKTRNSRVGYDYSNGDRSHYGIIGLDDQEMKKLIALLSGEDGSGEDQENNPLTELLS